MKASCYVVRIVFVVVLAIVGLSPTPVGAIPLLMGFGGPTGYGLPQNCLSSMNDGSYAGPPPAAGAAVPVDITPAFPSGVGFFGTTYRALYVNVNGNITFRGALGAYAPAAFPVADQPMIAPWWADVDTRGGGQPARNNICFHIEPNRVVVTWNNVGYFNSHDGLQNDFQLVLSAGACVTAGDVDVEFRYNRCQWTTGDASGGVGGLGGTPAQVGFDAGDRRAYVALPMSRTVAILDMCRTSNVSGGAPGLWRFQIRGGEVASGCAGSGTPCVLPGERGICADGVTFCSGAGVVCRRLNTVQAERCNGFDDDCDGVVDSGDGLCPDGQVCDRGACVSRCTAEGGCAPSRTCASSGVCVEDSCAGVTCPAGQRCSSGLCVTPCEGVICPVGRICRADRCIDPCVGVTCRVAEVCDTTSGRCIPNCECRGCPLGQYCLPDRRCVSDDCAGVPCPIGTYCRSGACRDACEAPAATRLCPVGESCQVGDCVLPGAVVVRDGGMTTDASMRTDAGADIGTDADGSTRGDAGADTMVSVDTIVSTDTMVSLDANIDGGADAVERPLDGQGVPDGLDGVRDGSGAPPGRAPSCQCHTVGARGRSCFGDLVFALGAAVLARRRTPAKLQSSGTTFTPTT